ncbi:MAG: hypothetical protein QXM43_02170 [Desulfurococcaceae archaeon]
MTPSLAISLARKLYRAVEEPGAIERYENPNDEVQQAAITDHRVKK